MQVGQRVGPFEIEKELGSGAMGTVYRASFDKDGAVIPVALKVVAFGLVGNEGAMARFDRESAILKQLRHRHIVRLIATGRYKQTPFIAMEFIDGEALDRVLARRGRLGWEDVVAYGKQLCDALQYAHEKGIIHRDLKPSNLMVMRDGTIKLTDFGIAKDTDVTALTSQNSTIGTAAYMSPEQCKGDRYLTNKSDLYSLGVVFYELLTGKKPFIAETTVDMFLKHVNEKPVRPSKHVPDLPVWLDNLVVFLLEKDKDRRPLDAATVAKMLEDIEEKVRTQHSAGADAANARRMDRPFGEKEMDETDREAAKTLRDGTKGKAAKKAKKRKRTPISEQAWLKAIPLVALLGIIGGVLWYALKPPGQGDLYRAWERAEAPEQKVERAEKYLERFGTLGDERTNEVRASLRKAKGQQLEDVLHKRYTKSFAGRKMSNPDTNEDPDAYGAAWAALEAEEKGELGQAAAFWKKIADGPEVRDRFASGWHWVADKHIAEIGSLDVKLTEIRGDLRQAQARELPWKLDETQPDSLARLAVRLDPGPQPIGAVVVGIDPTRKTLPTFRDEVKARKVWSAVAELAKPKPELRLWLFLGVRERDKRPDKKGDALIEDRAKGIEAVLTAVDAEWKRVGGNLESTAEQRDCRNRCRDVVELYGDETDDRVKKLVDRAKKLLDAMKPAG
jgi:serine/threonine-protein kinase